MAKVHYTSQDLHELRLSNEMRWRLKDERLAKWEYLVEVQGNIGFVTARTTHARLARSAQFCGQAWIEQYALNKRTALTAKWIPATRTIVQQIKRFFAEPDLSVTDEYGHKLSEIRHYAQYGPLYYR